ncbi:MAG: 3'-5' exonuclease, partial [archaeon]
NLSMSEMFLQADKVRGIGNKRAKSVRKFKEKTFDKLKNINISQKPPYDVAKEIYKKINFEKKIEKYINDNIRARIENMKYLFEDIHKFQQSNPSKTLNDYLLQMQLISDQDDVDKDTNKVSLMTVHAAKGLEFPVVFVIGLQDGTFPHNKAIEAYRLGEDPYGIEEERRLFYVATTRAEKKLILTHNRKNKRNQLQQPSRFIEELPSKFIKFKEIEGDYTRIGNYHKLNRIEERVI